MKSIDKVRQLIKDLNLDGILLSRRDNFSWLTGGKLNYILNTTEVGVASIYITHDNKYVVTSNIEISRIIDEEVGGMGFEPLVYSWVDSAESILAKLVEDKRVGSDNGVYGTENIFPFLVKLRSVLNEEEQGLYRQMGKGAAEAVEQVCRSVQPGWTELQIQAEVAREAYNRGINPACILVAADDRIFKYRHPIATKKVLDRYLMIVLGGEKYGLNASLTRFVHFGTLPIDIVVKNDKAAYIHASMIEATRPNETYSDFFREIQHFYIDAGYGEEWKLHHQGGLTGYACREFLVTAETSGKIQVNQAFAWNPSITGTKSEDTFILKQKGVQIITRTDDWPLKEIRTRNHVWDFPDILIR